MKEVYSKTICVDTGFNINYKHNTDYKYNELIVQYNSSVYEYIINLKFKDIKNKKDFNITISKGDLYIDFCASDLEVFETLLDAFSSFIKSMKEVNFNHEEYYLTYYHFPYGGKLLRLSLDKQQRHIEFKEETIIDSNKYSYRSITDDKKFNYFDSRYNYDKGKEIYIRIPITENVLSDMYSEISKFYKKINQ